MRNESLHIDQIRSSISEVRDKVLDHALYQSVTSTRALRIFMKYHVFAVWDFMSLLKTLQRKLTCVDVPWFPVPDSENSYLINEIVLGEESDVDSSGKRTSHFELYLKAMSEVGADQSLIHTFLEDLGITNNVHQSLEKKNIHPSVRNFVSTTFEIIDSDKPWVQAAVFTFGREDLIPSMFIRILNELSLESGVSVGVLRYYLERHVEIDGDHHSQLAIEMTSKLCGDDEIKWSEAVEAVKKSLLSRVGLWNGALTEIKNPG